MTDNSAPNDAADNEVVRILPETVTVRRAPKYGRFIVLGAGLGAIVTYILTSLFPIDPNVGFTALFAYFALFGVTGGALIGAVTALIIDRVSARRTRTVEAEHTIVEEGPIDGELLDQQD